VRHNSRDESVWQADCDVWRPLHRAGRVLLDEKRLTVAIYRFQVIRELLLMRLELRSNADLHNPIDTLLDQVWTYHCPKQPRLVRLP
jgi:hypothetical protein